MQCQSFRCGIAPIIMEIGRYYGISANKRFFHFCSDEVEDEIHVLLYSSMYNCVRDQLFKHAVYNNNIFMSLNDSEKNLFIFTNNDITYRCAKTCDVTQIRHWQKNGL